MSDQAKQKFWQAMAATPTLMIKLQQSDLHSEPMQAQLDKQANSRFWIYTTKDNRIAAGGLAMAQFVSTGHDVFACISGELVEETDSLIIDKYWSKEVEAWYPEGKLDTNLMMLRFELSDAEIWLVDATTEAKNKFILGADVNPNEVGSHYKVTL
ncbi:pyridoxamine 5'-phosphate oxidase family protein [Rheinheimera salexigens]|uniref:General stress protein n=1 Tax=Rheinheimera salexigens TaxID=1628148 RepID=A0A1E7Q2A2_9GAMM|nr:pyridoxamine 5'-phosphate oxidase family protein [Rheinheimera salexigens]OEY68307.1 general stress protein [Rheinheimera salexigens]